MAAFLLADDSFLVEDESWVEPDDYVTDFNFRIGPPLETKKNYNLGLVQHPLTANVYAI